MSVRMHCQLEFVGDTATLHVTGSLGNDHVETLVGVCADIPERIRTLRVNLHGVGQLSAATGPLRELLHYWHDTRHGEFRLTTSHVLAT